MPANKTAPRIDTLHICDRFANCGSSKLENLCNALNIQLTREEAIAKVIERGGTVKNSVSKKIDILVNANPPDAPTTKVKQALELQAQGYNIKIVSDEQFMKMLSDNDITELDTV